MSYRNFRPSRRSVIESLALGAAGSALGWPTRLASRSAHAATPRDAIRRLVVVYVPNGIPQLEPLSANFPAPPPGADPTAFDTPGTFAPVKDLKSDLVAFGNLCMAADVEDPGDTHINATAMILTGTTDAGAPTRKFTYALKSRGESIDNYLARKLGTQVTPQWPSLGLGIAIEKNGLAGITYLQDGTKVPSQRDPWTLYKSMFGNMKAPDGTKMQDDRLLSRLARRQSVLDSVKDDLKSFEQRLTPEDRMRTQAQLDAIRTLEARLTAPMMQNPTACKSPELGSPVDLEDGGNLLVQGKAMFSLLGAALACDLTRIAVVTIQGAATLVKGGKAFGYPVDFHGMSHGNNGNGESQDLTGFKTAKTGCFKMIVDFAKSLKNIPEGDGTMLDNTYILVVDENSTGHTHSRLPWWSLGGKNMGVNVGRYLALPNVPKLAYRYEGFHHMRLLRTLITMMGLPDDKFGLEQSATNPGVPGLLRT